MRAALVVEEEGPFGSADGSMKEQSSMRMRVMTEEEELNPVLCGG